MYINYKALIWTKITIFQRKLDKVSKTDSYHEDHTLNNRKLLYKTAPVEQILINKKLH